MVLYFLQFLPHRRQLSFSYASNSETKTLTLCSDLLEDWLLFLAISDSEVNVALTISLKIRSLT